MIFAWIFGGYIPQLHQMPIKTMAISWFLQRIEKSELPMSTKSLHPIYSFAFFDLSTRAKRRFGDLGKPFAIHLQRFYLRRIFSLKSCWSGSVQWKTVFTTDFRINNPPNSVPFLTLLGSKKRYLLNGRMAYHERYNRISLVLTRATSWAMGGAGSPVPTNQVPHN